jgi:cytochrome P450
MRSLMAPADLPRIRSIARQATAEGIASRTSPDGTLDLVPALGRAVPVRIVQDYFGFRAPTADLLRWSHQTQDSFFHNVPYVRGFRGFLIRTFGLGGEPLQARQREAAEVHHAAFRAGEEMRSFLDDYIAHHSAEILAEDTVLSRMLRVNDSLTHPKEMDRIRSNVMGGLIGAVETSNAAIVQSVHQILRRPDVLARARAAAAAAGDEPAAVAAFSAFVWEALRFHPINPFVVRYVQQDVWIGSGDQAVLLREGRRVLVATHSAMLDPRSVQDPDAFRTDRPERDREMNLGYAMHRCLGDHVAQAMVPEVVRQILLLPDLARVESDPPLELNQGIDFGARGSFPEHYFVRHRVSERAGL